MITVCEGVCRVDRLKDICSTCLRTTFEISRWTQMENQERQALVDTVLPQRRLKADQEALDKVRVLSDN